MYAVEQAVRELCVNVRTSFTPGLFAAQAAMVDAQLDSMIGAKYWWPIASDGTDLSSDPPELIRQIANQLVAAKIEALAYAQNEAGQSQPNPYGVSMKRDAMKLLNSLLEGRIRIPELERRSEVRVSTPSKVFKPSTGLSRSGRSR